MRRNALLKTPNARQRLIGRIRDLARSSDPEKSLLDINETIRETIPLLQRELLRQRVSLRLELASTLPKVLGDRVQLQQVIINLMVNGVEAVANAIDLPRELVIGSRHHDPDLFRQDKRSTESGTRRYFNDGHGLAFVPIVAAK